MAEQLPGTTIFTVCALCWLSPVIKAQETVMTKIDVGLAGSLHGSALPPCQHVSESPIFGQHGEDR